MKPVRPSEVTSLKGNGRQTEVRKLPVEALFTLYLNDTEVLTFMVTPEKLKELAAGFLLSAGVISRRENIKKILVKEDDGLIWAETTAGTDVIQKLLSRRYLTSGCGGGNMLGDPLTALSLKPSDSELKITAASASRIVELMLEKAALYLESGGLHGAGLFIENEIIYLAEDIGRHNAVDKVLGAALLDNLATVDKVLSTTGRISSEMLIKAARSGVPIILSRTSPTALAVQLADKLNITVAGYVRPRSMKIYSCDWRIL